MKRYFGDCLVIAGAGVLVYATFMWSNLAGWYVLGSLLVVGGIIVELAGYKRGK